MPPLAGFDALKTRRARSLRTPAGRRNSSTCTRKSSRSSSVSDDSDAPPSSSSGSHPPCSGRGHTASDGERARGRQAGGRTQRRASARATLARAHPRRTHAGSTCTRASAIPRAPLHRAPTPFPPRCLPPSRCASSPPRHEQVSCSGFVDFARPAAQETASKRGQRRAQRGQRRAKLRRPAPTEQPVSVKRAAQTLGAGTSRCCAERLVGWRDVWSARDGQRPGAAAGAGGRVVWARRGRSRHGRRRLWSRELDARGAGAPPSGAAWAPVQRAGTGAL